MFFPMHYSEHQMNHNPESQKALFNALINFTAETKDIVADSVNPFHKSRYASLSKHLETLKPLLHKHGLAIIQFPCGYDKEVGVRTFVIHTDGGYLSTDALIPCEAGMKGQEAGAIYSYVRRYAIASICGTATEDDDCEIDRMSKTAPKAKAPAKTESVVSGTGVFAAPAAKPAKQSGEAVVPFGDRKGQPLTSLPLKETDRSVKCGDLYYWAKVWTPKPFGNSTTVSPKDAFVKSEAERLWSESNKSEPQVEQDEVPF